MGTRYLRGFTLLLGVLGVLSDTQRILWGQCYSNCLTQHSESIEQVPEETRGKGGAPSLIRNCRKVKDCKTCLFACDRSTVNYTSIESCVQDCDVSIGVVYPNHESCRQSCRFLATAAQARVGTCPSPSSMTGFQAACVDQCRHDADCSGSKKCCHNGCGFTCLRPRNDKTLPKKPKDILFETRKDGGIVISWDMPKGKWRNHTIHPIVYVVRWRIKTINYAVTDRMYLKLRHIAPASRIHVIVAAVNVDGSRGFTAVSEHIKEFTPPSPPINFEEGATTLHDGKVDVEVMWQPPHQTGGVDILRYVVQRSEGLPQTSSVYHRVNMSKYRVPPNKTKFIFKDLDQGTRYFIQVYAVVRWQRKTRNGRMSSKYLITYSPPRQANSERKPTPWMFKDNADSPIYNITVDQSVFREGVLKARIQWKAITEERLEKYLVYWRASSCDRTGRTSSFDPQRLHSATTHDEQFHVYNLHYSCNYTVHIKPVNAFGDTLPGSLAVFTTPHCVDIKVQGNTRPECPKKASSIPQQPRDVQIHWLIDQCQIDVEIMWEEPVSTQPITAYSVQWGRSQEVAPKLRHVVYNKQPQEVTLSGNETSVRLPDLETGRHYSVQISAVSRSGEGEKAVKHFRTRRRPCDDDDKVTTQSPIIESTTSAPTQPKTAKPVTIICVAVDSSGNPSVPKCSSSHLATNWGLLLLLLLSFVLL